MYKYCAITGWDGFSNKPFIWKMLPVSFFLYENSAYCLMRYQKNILLHFCIFFSLQFCYRYLFFLNRIGTPRIRVVWVTFSLFLIKLVSKLTSKNVQIKEKAIKVESLWNTSHWIFWLTELVQNNKSCKSKKLRG